MGRLTDELEKMGFLSTDRESPVHEDGELWTDGHELVCDETGIVIDGNHHGDSGNHYDRVHRYRHSGRVRLIGGYLSNYDWGKNSENKFRY